MEKLEDMASAANIPRVAILNPSSSIDEMQIKDVKSIILRNQSSEQAVRDVMDRLAAWLIERTIRLTQDLKWL